jgi:hypothetical protein
MIIYDFGIMCVIVTPSKTDPILFVYPNTVLTFSFSMKLFKPITRWDTKIGQIHRTIQHPEFSKGNSLHFSWQFPRKFASEYLFCFLALE